MKAIIIDQGENVFLSFSTTLTDLSYTGRSMISSRSSSLIKQVVDPADGEIINWVPGTAGLTTLCIVIYNPSNYRSDAWLNYELRREVNGISSTLLYFSVLLKYHDTIPLTNIILNLILYDLPSVLITDKISLVQTTSPKISFSGMPSMLDVNPLTIIDGVYNTKGTHITSISGDVQVVNGSSPLETEVTNEVDVTDGLSGFTADIINDVSVVNGSTTFKTEITNTEVPVTEGPSGFDASVTVMGEVPVTDGPSGLHIQNAPGTHLDVDVVSVVPISADCTIVAPLPVPVSAVGLSAEIWDEYHTRVGNATGDRVTKITNI